MISECGADVGRVKGPVPFASVGRPEWRRRKGSLKALPEELISESRLRRTFPGRVVTLCSFNYMQVHEAWH